jgi:hypothetical protein
MRRNILTTLALCLAVAVAIAVSPAVAKDKMGQLNGTVHMMNKDTSTITVQKGSVTRQIVFNADTKWSYGTQASPKASSLDQLKEGWYINCKGTYDGVKLVASACRFRESK